MLVYTSFNGHKGKLVGIITVQDILRVIMGTFKIIDESARSSPISLLDIVYSYKQYILVLPK